MRAEQLTDKLKDKVERTSVTYWAGLTTDLIKMMGQRGDGMVLIRGLRNGHDLAYEMNQLRVMQDLLPDIQTVMIPCDKEYEHVSSSMIRSLRVFDPSAATRYEL